MTPTMNPEIAEGLKNKAKATLLRTDAIQADSAELIEFEDWKKYPDALRYAGKYVILHRADEVVAIYKMVVHLGPAKATRTKDGAVAYEVASFSTGLKRIKRVPKGLLNQEEETK